VQNHKNLMRDIFSEIFENRVIDPTEAARRAVRPRLRKRFYRRAEVGEETGEGFPVRLDGKPVRTPAGRLLAAPTRALAEAVAAEWNAQTDEIDPARMPLTRLANAVIDGVAEKPQAVADEIAKYLGSDLVFYRAGTPAGLVARESEHWDPLLAWAHEAFGARFIPVEGVVFVEQPAGALAAMRAALPAAAGDMADIWRLGALSSITALTGSALIALALAHEALDAEAAWAAAHVDEDWQMSQWGRDALVLAARAFHEAELRAAAAVLKHV
jgi:chaperone required for assembly of F1-ATPase